LRSWLKEGRVSVDQEVIKLADTPLSKGQVVHVSAKPSFIGDKLRIVYEDSHLVAIEKPTGLLSVATAFEKGDTAHAILKRHYHPKRVQVVHRIDQDTSGVMLFALSQQGYEGLKALFETHEIERSYCAIVEGKVKSDKGVWKSYLYEDSTYLVHSTKDSTKGAIAITHYATQASTPHYTKLRLTLETGRKNQIRVHCQEAGNPIVGDKKYGAKTDPYHRLFLHAEKLAFIHPVTNKKMLFESLPPKIFDQLMGR
jgi:tRNA pseudouridine32 synthase/23S rRNA pseudouridine746 synthase/23S rRNA pseudouridine1911/1915/1917 synthase